MGADVSGLDPGTSAPRVVVALEERLLEREQELEAIGSLLDAATVSRAPAALLVQGPAGIGKSALLRRVAALARARRLAVVAVRAQPTAPEIPFGVARDLARGLHALAGDEPGGHDPLVPDVARAREVVDPVARLHRAFVGLVADAAASRPLVLVVDDAHWCDAGSAGALEALVDEVAGGGLLIVLGLRTRAGGAHDDAAGLAALGRRASVARLRPRVLGRGAADAIVASRLGLPPSSAFAAACHAITDGNPLLLHAVLAAAATAGLRPDDGAVGRLPQLAAAGVRSTVVERLAALGAPAVELLRAVAVLEPEGRLDDAAILAGVTTAEALVLADRLVEAELLDASGTRVVHPAVREAVLAELAPGRLTSLRRHAAERLRAAGAGAMRVGGLLEPTLPLGDAWVAEALGDAAAQALADGVPDLAARLLTRAVAEPPAPGDRCELTVRQGEALALAGDPSAVDVLGAALAALDGDDALHHRALRAQGHALLVAGRIGEAVELLEGELAGRGGADEAAEDVVVLACDLITAATLHADLAGRARDELPRWHARARKGGDAALLLLAHEALALSVTGHTDRAVAVAREALAGGRLLRQHGPGRLEPVAAAHTLMYSGCLAEALEAYEAMLAHAKAAGSPMAVAGALAWRSQLRLRTGELRGAEEDAATAVAIHAEQRARLHLPAELAYLAVAQLERGALSAAQETIATTERGAPADPHHALSFLAHDARGRVLAAEGRHAEAVEAFLAAGDGVERWGATNPAVLPWRSRAAHSLVAVGDLPAAERLALEELALTEAARHDRGRGLALRALAAARPERALEHLQEAVAILACGEDRLTHARALAELGGALRRRREPREAREPLREALDLADRCGAEGLADWVREELLSAGARPRRSRLSGADALTPAERRVAALAAAGRSNREICAELFLSPKTIETHLGRVYRKLSVAGRGELADALEREPPPA